MQINVLFLWFLQVALFDSSFMSFAVVSLVNIPRILLPVHLSELTGSPAADCWVCIMASRIFGKTNPFVSF